MNKNKTFADVLRAVARDECEYDTKTGRIKQLWLTQSAMRKRDNETQRHKQEG